MTRLVAAVDFDGVIHTYFGWDGNPPTGRPIDGVVAGLQRLKDAGFSLVCFTARDAPFVQQWLDRHALGHYFSEVTNTKPKEAIVLFDDRAVRVPANVPYGLDRAASMFLLGFVIDKTA